MAEAKIQIKLGTIEFLGEGDEKWVATQLDKILAQAANLLTLAPATMADPGGGKPSSGARDGDPPKLGTDVTLVAFLKNKNAGNSQVKRFLATAVWLVEKGNKMPTTSDVTKALRDNHQPKLTNPANSLNQNVAKGLCEKSGKQFFVTPDGLASMIS